ncbi:transient receptor potential cation channel subfamily A member 1-like isoform X2 [Lineus longissimus]|uniref:transient receptor potential cation channel subfamily A member 1-like isoform X2 n=1 Tax=Lineus longissimus TaxID=88925 RepID=UPI00315DEA12
MAGNFAAVATVNKKKRTRRALSKGVSFQRRPSRVGHAPDLDGWDNEAYEDNLSLPHNAIPVTQAAREGLVDVVQCHIQNNPRCVFTREDGNECTPLHQAARFNRVSVVNMLLEAGAEANASESMGLTPLHLSARYNSADSVQALIKYGASVNARDQRGKTAVHYAARRGFNSVVKELLSPEDSNVNIQDDDKITPLHEAATGGQKTVCEILVEKGADPWSRDVSDITPLINAASVGSVEVINALLEAVSKDSLKDEPKQAEYLSLVDDEGSNALQTAAQNGHLKVVELLLSKGIDINSMKSHRRRTDKKVNKQTALHVAVTNGFKEIVEYLLKQGAEANPRDTEQMTPIHRAALHGREDTIQTIMKHGGDLNAMDRDNLTPLHCACWKGHPVTTKLLVENGAQFSAVDTSLRTCLHWAVQNGQYDVLQPVLQGTHGHFEEMNGARTIVDWKDNMDQTALHYAAAIGNTAILQRLLEFGANPSQTDLEGKTPLHIASEKGNIGCAESLVAASKGELNDPDVDGMSPLLLASSNGNRQMVKVLTALGADNSTKDDQKRTALMLAATNGHSSVVSILVDDHADVHATDRYKNTALHYACANNQTQTVKLLLAKKADVIAKNNKNDTPLDLAMQNLSNEAAIAILQSDKWRRAMEARDKKGNTPMKKLIKRLPEAAKVVMDQCVKISSDDPADIDLEMTFQYKYIDPGPDDPMCKAKRWLALETMAKYGRRDLLSHPLCQNILTVKWQKFARYLFYLNLLTYIVFVIMMMIFIFTVATPIRTVNIDNVNYCPITLPADQANNTTLLNFYIANGQLTWEQRAYHDGYHAALCGLCLTIAFIFFIKEVVVLVKSGYIYFFEVGNWLAVILIAFTVAALSPPMYAPCLWQWRCAWIATFTSWINFTMYLRRIDGVGLYVIMFTAVIKSMAKIALILFLLMFAFASAFYIVLAKQAIWESLGTNLVTTLVMTLGEINYFDNFAGQNLEPFKTDAYILLVLFIFLMPIMMMNLTVGVAIGDIDSIQKNSYIKRLELQMHVIKDMEGDFPKALQRKLWRKQYSVKPNKSKRTRWRKFMVRVFGLPTTTEFMQDDSAGDYGEAISQEVMKLKTRMSYVTSLLDHHSIVLHQIAQKMNVETPAAPPDTLSHSSELS